MPVADEVLPSTLPTRTVAGESRPTSDPPGPDVPPPLDVPPPETIATVVDPVPALVPVPPVVVVDGVPVVDPVTDVEDVVTDVVVEVVVVWVMFSVVVSAAATLKLRACVEDAPDESVTRTVTLTAPISPTPGVPPRLAVPFPLSVNVSHDGKVVALKLNRPPSGSLALSPKLNAVPAVASLGWPPVKLGASLTSFTVTVNVCVAVPPEASVAVNVTV